MPRKIRYGTPAVLSENFRETLKLWRDTRFTMNLCLGEMEPSEEPYRTAIKQNSDMLWALRTFEPQTPHDKIVHDLAEKLSEMYRNETSTEERTRVDEDLYMIQVD